MTQLRSLFDRAQRCFDLARTCRRRAVAEALQQDGVRYWRLAQANRHAKARASGMASSSSFHSIAPDVAAETW